MAKERDHHQKQREALEAEEEELSAQVTKIKANNSVTICLLKTRAKSGLVAFSLLSTARQM